jgi:hypothetical protein
MKKTLILFALIAFSGSGSFLSAQEAEATATAVRVPAVSLPKSALLSVTVELQGGQKITGVLTEMTELPFRGGAVGEVKIQLSEVAGIKLASADDPSTSIIFKNGDSITGATDLKSVSVDTDWGNAKINGSSILSLILLPDLKWTSVMQATGKRWSLQDIKATPGSQPAQPSFVVPGQTSPLPNPPTSTTPNRPATQNRPSSQFVPN